MEIFLIYAEAIIAGVVNDTKLHRTKREVQNTQNLPKEVKIQRALLSEMRGFFHAAINNAGKKKMKTLLLCLAILNVLAWAALVWVRFG